MGWNDNHTKVTKERAIKLKELGKVKSIDDKCPYCYLPIQVCSSWDKEALLELEGGEYI
jgi:biotin synthase-like enzyme